jgi:hypothetical protein
MRIAVKTLTTGLLCALVLPAGNLSPAQLTQSVNRPVR